MSLLVIFVHATIKDGGDKVFLRSEGGESAALVCYAAADRLRRGYAVHELIDIVANRGEATCARARAEGMTLHELRDALLRPGARCTPSVVATLQSPNWHRVLPKARLVSAVAGEHVVVEDAETAAVAAEADAAAAAAAVAAAAAAARKRAEEEAKAAKLRGEDEARAAAAERRADDELSFGARCGFFLLRRGLVLGLGENHSPCVTCV